MNTAPHCPISRIPMDFAFEETVLGQFKVHYYRCTHCGLLQTEAPYWLEQAYQEPITSGDTGLVARNIGNSRFLEIFLSLTFSSNARFVDLAGGYGLLTRLLRDKGFDCFSTDPYCPNLFASSFEPQDPFKADALFAFEVLEHIHNPVEFIEQQFNKFGCRTLVFSTLTFNPSIPPREWWYYAFDTGQHITFYQRRSLELLAKLLCCSYFQINPGLHVFSDVDMPITARLAITNKWARFCLSVYAMLRLRKKSLTWHDHLLDKERYTNASAD